MKTLIVEDDPTSRMVLQELLKGYGPTHIAVNGKEAVDAVLLALEANDPYRVIFLDIMMPEMDGQQALKEIRMLEAKKGLKGENRSTIVMTTTLNDKTNVITATENECDYYVIKPYDKVKLLQVLRKMKVIW